MSEKIKKKSKVAISARRDYENIHQSHLNVKDEYELIFDEDGEDTSYRKLIEYALSFKPIEDEETIRKLIQSAQNGNINDQNLLVEANLRAALHIIRKYFNSEGEIEDMIQEANLGIIYAIKKFDLNKNVKFSTFLYRCVISQLHNYLYKITPVMTHSKPPKRLMKYISLTELNDLVRNFIDVSDLSGRIAHYTVSIQILIKKYVFERLLTIISFEEHEEEVLDEIHSSTQRDYVSVNNFAYTFAMIRLHRAVKYCALGHMSKEKFELFIKANGLFGYQEPPNLNKYLKEIGVNPKTYAVFKQKFIMNVFDNREYHDFLKKYVDKVIETRSYYYEEV